MQFYNAKCDVRMQNLCRIGVCALSSGAVVFCHQSSRLCTALTDTCLPFVVIRTSFSRARAVRAFYELSHLNVNAVKVGEAVSV